MHAAVADDDGGSVIDEMIGAREKEPPTVQYIETALPVIMSKLRNILARMMRPFSNGPGLRVRACILCGRWSNSRDRCFPNESFILWPHVEEDGVTIIGFVDKWCNDMLRRCQTFLILIATYDY